MKIRDVMTPNPRTVSPNDTIQAAARVMQAEDTGAVPVVNDGRVLAVVTDRDIVVRVVAEGGSLSTPVGDIASKGRRDRDARDVDKRGQRVDERASDSPASCCRKRSAGRHRVDWRSRGQGREGQPLGRHAAEHFGRRQRKRSNQGRAQRDEGLEITEHFCISALCPLPFRRISDSSTCTDFAPCQVFALITAPPPVFSLRQNPAAAPVSKGPGRRTLESLRSPSAA